MATASGIAITDGGSGVRPDAVALLPHRLTATAWITTDALTLEEWLAQGRRLGTVGRSAGWWVGDWLRYGNARWGERYARAAKVTGYDAHTLRNIVYVASRFELSRRRDNLSFSHHAEVAALARDEQERWLTLAESQRMSVRDLRLELRGARDKDSAAAATADPSAAHDPTRVCPQCGFRMHGDEGAA